MNLHSYFIHLHFILKLHSILASETNSLSLSHTHNFQSTSLHCYLMFHLEVLHKVEVSEHPDCAQCRFQVRQLKVAEAEVSDFKGLGRWYHSSLG